MAGIPLVLGFHFDAWERACLFLVHSPISQGPSFAMLHLSGNPVLTTFLPDFWVLTPPP
jgi:hypothetical protein